MSQERHGADPSASPGRRRRGRGPAARGVRDGRPGGAPEDCRNSKRHGRHQAAGGTLTYCCSTVPGGVRVSPSPCITQRPAGRAGSGAAAADQRPAQHGLGCVPERDG